MKKLINRPEDVVREELAGIALAHAGRLVVHTDPHWIARADAPVGRQGGHRLRRRVGARAAARRIRRPGHARRRLPGRGLHLADAGPDARRDAGRRRRRRHPAHRQELHRRRHELRDGRRPRARRGTRRGAGRDRRRRRRQGQPVHRRTPRRRRHRARGEDLRRGGGGGPAARGGGRPLPRRSTSAAAAWAWRSPRAPRPWPASRPSTSATTRWRSASASTASRGESAGRWPPPARSSRRSPAPSSTTCPSRAATACSPSSTAWAARRSWSSTSSTTKLHRFLDERGIAIARNLVGSYMTSLDMAGCSITLLRLDDELLRLWDAPVDTPGLRWGA